MQPVRRTIYPEVKVLDKTKGTVEYVASDQSVDSYKEIIKADGWRFTNFSRNSPFVDSHNYGSIEQLVGKVIDYHVTRGQLHETVQWAIDVPENKLAQIGWRMTEAGYLKAVSVGFWPVRWISPTADRNAFVQELSSLGLPADSQVRTIYQEQEQIELSSVIIGANPNALAKGYKAGALSDDDLEFVSKSYADANAGMSTSPGFDIQAASRARQQLFLDRLEKVIKRT